MNNHNGFSSYPPYPGYTWGFGHCSGCRCFASTTTLTTTYVPRHRKPGPAH